jgi:hypothetical protein
MIIIEPCAGLGNRFIALACAYNAAKELNTGLTVVWKRETVLGASMNQLFTLPPEVKVKECCEYGYKLDFFGQIRGNACRRKYRKMSDSFFECDEIMELYNQSGKAGVIKAIQSAGNIYIKATNPFWDIFEADNAFDFITPNKEILDRRGKVLEGAAGKRLVGVHIRRTDHIEAITNSPLELFVERMNKELSEYPDTYFYLASDDKDVERQLKGIFDDRIITFDDKCLARDTVQGIKDAYVEMLCLSAGSRIFGSFNSTFSLMAAKFSNIPLEVISTDKAAEKETGNE